MTFWVGVRLFEAPLCRASWYLWGLPLVCNFQCWATLTFLSEWWFQSSHRVVGTSLAFYYFFSFHFCSSIKKIILKNSITIQIINSHKCKHSWLFLICCVFQCQCLHLFLSLHIQNKYENIYNGTLCSSFLIIQNDHSPVMKIRIETQHFHPHKLKN
jgi:hypothetical protein